MSASSDRFEQIRSRFEAEARANRKPRTATDLPHTYEDINPEWLTRVLCAKHPAAHVVGAGSARPTRAPRAAAASSSSTTRLAEAPACRAACSARGR